MMKTFKLSFRATGIFVTYLLGVCILLVSCGIYTDNSFSVSQTNSYDLSDDISAHTSEGVREDISDDVSDTDSSTPDTSDGKITVHFIDVGQADCSLIMCNGMAMLIDGGNAADSDLVFTYLSRLGIKYLDYIVLTHAHEDHVGGLSGALAYAKAGTALSPVTDYDSKAFRNFTTALERQGVDLVVPQPGYSFSLGDAEVTVLGPVSDCDEPNNTSIVLRIVFGEISFLFTGDAEREEEAEILSSGAELSADILKVGHHGSDTSTSYPFLREVMPQVAVISVGKNNSYSHPDESVLSRLSDAGATTLRTDEQGDIICESDGKTFELRNGNGKTLYSGDGNGAADIPEQSYDQSDEPENTRLYILNTSTKKIHLPDCRSAAAISPENRKEYTGTIDEPLAMGYSPCGNCHPDKSPDA